MRNLDCMVEIRGRVQHGRMIAYGWRRGHIFVAAVVLPPFVAADPEKYPDVIKTAKKKAAREVTLLIEREIGAPQTFLSTESNEHAPRN